MSTACFDIGGSTIKAALAHSPEHIEPLGSVATPTRDFDAFVEVLESFMTDARFTPITPVSIALAGVVDRDTGRLSVANIACIDGRPLARELGARLSRRVVIVNDADSFALAEAYLGAGYGHRVVFGIILGTGVGGGVVVDGRLLEGAGGSAGEWGHAPIVTPVPEATAKDLPRFACGCGQIGCVDTVGGARGLERIHRTLTGDTLTSTEIMARWRAGERAAARTVTAQVELVAEPLALCVNLLGADIVPVGGGLSAETGLIEALDRAVRARILRRLDQPLVVPGACHAQPGMTGAALSARRAFGDHAV